MKKLGNFKIVVIATLSAIVLAASIAVAQAVKTDTGSGQAPRSGWHGRREPRWGMQGAFLQKLNLTDDQKAKMKQIRESFAASNKPLFDQLRAKRQELRQASEGGTFNEALATQKLTDMAGLQARMMGARIKLHQDMLSVLTTEQKTQLDQMKAQFKARHAGQRGQQ